MRIFSVKTHFSSSKQADNALLTNGDRNKIGSAWLSAGGEGKHEALEILVTVD